MSVETSQSILNTIKKMLGLDADYNAFDTDIIIFINNAFSYLNQLGVGPEEGYSISGATDSWSDYLGNDARLEFVKTYIYLKVKVIFDPPQSGSVLDAYNKEIKELEWRINVQVDPGE